MSFATTNTALATLALAANVLTAGIVGSFALARFSVAGSASWSRLRATVAPYCVPFAWVIGIVCTSGSLYLQFGEQLTPCDFCWFQRICMYPQALILGIAVLSGDRYMVKRYMIPLAAIGAAISVTHIALPNLMAWLRITAVPGCSLAAPCSVQPITVWGFATVPYMALSGFLAIIALLGLTQNLDDNGEGGT